MSDSILGKLLTATAQRDAIHVAIAPVTSAIRLLPGQHVGMVSPDVVGPSNDTIGIVDPFLILPVEPGQRFYLCLYPRTVTSLRHHWTHPAFEDENIQREPLSTTTQLLVSQDWITSYVRRHCPYWEDEDDGGYAEFIRYVEHERWIYYNGEDCHSLGDVADADELFRHLSVVLNRAIDASYFEEFTCSC